MNNRLKINNFAALIGIIVAVLLIVMNIMSDNAQTWDDAQTIGMILILAALISFVALVLNIIGLIKSIKDQFPIIGNIIGIIASVLFLFLPISEGTNWVVAIVFIIASVMIFMQKKKIPDSEPAEVE